LRIENLAPHIGDTFTIHLDGAQPLAVELAEVNDLRERTSDARQPAGQRTPFSIVFRSASNVALPQRIYHLDHAALGGLELFLVTIGPDARGMRYEAIFT
jgi:hypothetical protein